MQSPFHQTAYIPIIANKNEQTMNKFCLVYEYSNKIPNYSYHIKCMCTECVRTLKIGVNGHRNILIDWVSLDCTKFGNGIC